MKIISWSLRIVAVVGIVGLAATALESRRELRRLKTGGNPPAATTQPSAGVTPGSPGAAAPTFEQYRAQILSTYRQEQRDPAWSAEAEKHLTATARAALPRGSQILSVACHTTMCLMEVAHADAQAARSARPGSWILLVSRGWEGSVLVAGEREERGELIQTVIAQRLEGHAAAATL